MRIYFLYDRKLLAKLSICEWKVLSAYLKSAVPSDGCFLNDGNFSTAPGFMLENLEKAFQYEVLKMFKKERKINDAIIENMLSWYHIGFHVYIGNKIDPDDKTGLGNLAKYIIRACFER